MKKTAALLLLTALVLTGCGCRPMRLAETEPQSTSVLPAAELSLPTLTVEQGNHRCEAMICSYNWNIDNGDGTGSGICVDAVHPLTIADTLPLLEAETPEATLIFPETPETIMACCWEKTDEDFQSIAVDGSAIQLLPGTYVYQVTACWPDRSGFDNIVHYSFRANLPER